MMYRPATRRRCVDLFGEPLYPDDPVRDAQETRASIAAELLERIGRGEQPKVDRDERDVMAGLIACGHVVRAEHGLVLTRQGEKALAQRWVLAARRADMGCVAPGDLLLLDAYERQGARRVAVLLSLALGAFVFLVALAGILLAWWGRRAA